MANVEIKVRNNVFTISCREDERDHILRLANIIDNRLSSIEKTVGRGSDMLLMVIGALMVEDQLLQAQSQLAAVDPKVIEEQMLQTLEVKLQQRTQVIISQIIDGIIEKLEELEDILEAHG